MSEGDYATCSVTVRRTTGFTSVTEGVCEDGGVTEPVQPDAPEMRDVHAWHFPRLIIAWFLTAVIGLLVTLLVPTEDRFPWLVFAVGASTLVTFALQLGTAQRVGFITRVAFSVAGSVLVIASIDVIGLLVIDTAK